MSTGYKILSQAPEFEISPAGNGFRNVWSISYEIMDGPARGTVGKLTVPEADHNAEYVGKAIADKIGHLDAISMLGQTGE